MSVCDGARQGRGAALVLAHSLIALARGDAWLSLVLVFLCAALFTSLASNNVAAVLVFPVAQAVAQSMGVSLVPFAVTIMVAASASFATPLGYQSNLMVYNAGDYRFADFLRVGLPLTFLEGVVAVALVPLIWPF